MLLFKLQSQVHQTGDLASLSYLDKDQLALLPSLLKLRDALYSPTFRAFIRSVTGCGPLSGSKQDMSVNSYKKGCHLLNHDDVIGTRRVSYILYMPLPHTKKWEAEWGGALELYDIRPNADGIPEPLSEPSKILPPAWNQFIFFEVQPGRSFHSVEEVTVGEGVDVRERLSISGWFHAAQEGEEGYDPNPVAELKSSRDQLVSANRPPACIKVFNSNKIIQASTFTDLKSYPEITETFAPSPTLSSADTSFLSTFLNPVYLQPRTLSALAERFAEESSLELHTVLAAPLADKLEAGLRALDARDGLGPERETAIPPHGVGTSEGWVVKGPPHKWRYCTLAGGITKGAHDAVATVAAPDTSPEELLRVLQDTLFPSAAFRAWLAALASLVPMRHAVCARRFRPGLDYTLATSEEDEARLDVVLGLTPMLGEKDKEERGWELGEWGGWECYMAPHEEEDDPAVYRSSGGKKTKESTKKNEDAKPATRSSTRAKAKTRDEDEEMEDEDDSGTLLTAQPGFNRLLIVLRDEGVMRFVKYVSAAAEGSRWDVCGEYEVGMLQEEEDDDSSE
jgi:prolyl 3-hydroxylase /prolyl 3,4-dihydroxylase